MGPVVCKLRYVCMLHSSSVSGISVDCAPAMQALWSKGIESDSHLSIHTMYVLIIINAMMNLKLFGPLVLIGIEINWPGSWFTMAVLGCRSLVLVIIILIIIISVAIYFCFCESLFIQYTY